MPIRPESDWSDLNSDFVADFAILARFAAHDLTLDVRTYDWVRPTAGQLLPRRHYLDISLDGAMRRSVLRSERWAEPQYSGSVLYLPPNALYWGQPALERRKLLCMSFGDAFLENVFEDTNPLHHAIPQADIQNGALRRHLLAMAGELAAPGFAAGPLLEAMAIAATVELARWSQLIEDPATGTVLPHQARRIEECIRENLSSALSISDIGRACGMSTRNVARVFKQATGVSIGDFIARCRIDLAKDMLASDELRIKEVSWRCGFRSSSAFSAAFRAATGMTPRDYRMRRGMLQ
ncbi:AraC family transcriptional regulator [Sphingobium fontiphilum]|uniref:AraC family transcriptional regulator n=1 Tax=Sphingobium fontiphilum TaxID=944425 RepID=A0A7W6GPP4_9SPHN|nr:AraC family transcriptional regulator [Sphingobium fontiphilum]MBB3982757.1 AraC family transcriptional regulator [Sphingobium fontiphilum]